MTKDYKPEPRIKAPIKKERRLSTSDLLDDLETDEESSNWWDEMEAEIEQSDGSFDNKD